MTESLPPLFDIARQSTLVRILAAVQALNEKVNFLMTQDDAAAAQLTDIDAKLGLTNTALGSMQAAVDALRQQLAQAAVGLSPATQALLDKAQADSNAVAAQAQADAAADAPPAPPAP